MDILGLFNKIKDIFSGFSSVDSGQQNSVQIGDHNSDIDVSQENSKRTF